MHPYVVRETTEKVRTVGPAGPTATNSTKWRPKIRRFTSYDPTDLSDALAILAANVEEAYVQCGVADYTVEQCMTHAVAILPLFAANGGKWASETTIGWSKYECGEED